MKSFLSFYQNHIHFHIKNWILSFRLFAGTIVPISLVYFLFIFLDQGQDIILITVEDQVKCPGYIATGTLIVLLWSLLLWYPARLISYADPFGISPKYLEVFPRIIGFNAVVVVHTSVFLLPMCINSFGKYIQFSISNNSVGYLAFAYVLFQNLIFVIFTYFYDEWKNIPVKKKIILFVSTSAILSSIPWLFVFIPNWNTQDKSVYFITLFSIIFSVILILLQWILWIFQIERRKENINIKFLNNVFSNWIILKIQTNNNAHSKDPAYGIFLIGVVILGVLSISGWWYPNVSYVLGPFYTPLSSLALLGAFFTWCRAVFIRKRLSIVFNIFLMVAIVLITTKSDTSNIEIKQTLVEENRIDAIEAIQKRLQYILDKDTIPDTAYIVLADGGASRSGYWATLILNKLNRQMNGRLKDHLLIMSSTSGGSVGNGYFYRLLAQSNSSYQDVNLLEKQCSTFFNGDFLSHPLSNMLFPDIFALSNIYGYDRGHALISSMEWQSKQNSLPPIDLYNEDSFDELYNWKKELPLLFLNTTSMLSGEPGVISNVKIKSNYSFRKDVLRFSDSQAYSIPFSSAMIMSSRFPFISPGGKLGNDCYVDGGYFDNSGSGIVLDVLAEAIKDETTRSLLQNVYIKIIHIKNDEGIYFSDSTYMSISEMNALLTVPNEVPNRWINNYLSPGVTVLKTYSSQTSASDFNFLRWFRTNIARSGTDFYNQYDIYNLYNDTTLVKKSNYENNEYLMGYPMSWIISNYNMERMKNSADAVFRDVYFK